MAALRAWQMGVKTAPSRRGSGRVRTASDFPACVVGARERLTCLASHAARLHAESPAVCRVQGDPAYLRAAR